MSMQEEEKVAPEQQESQMLIEDTLSPKASDTPEKVEDELQDKKADSERMRKAKEAAIKYNIFNRCWYSKKDANNYKTIDDLDLHDITEAEKELVSADWDAFKTDVSMKTLIQTIDKSIKRRHRLYYHDDDIHERRQEPIESDNVLTPADNDESSDKQIEKVDTRSPEQKELDDFRVKYGRFKIFKIVALVLYTLLPFLEKPGWCLKDEKIDVHTSEGYWYCNNKDGTIANSNIPKLPANAVNIIYIVCLVILLYYTKARDFYRKRDARGDTVFLQLCLIVISLIDIAIALVAFNFVADDNSFFVQMFYYPYICAFIRPVLFTLQVRSVKSFWRRYLSVIRGSLPMVIFILIYVFYFAWMGNRLFAGTIEGVENFSGLDDSFFYMFVLLTTSNFPDVMLPSYSQKRHYAAFFIIYLVIGLFLLMNLLLAIFYANYQERVEKSMDNFKEARDKFLIFLFRKYSKDDKCNRENTREIIQELHSLINGKDTKGNDLKEEMSDLQFEQVFKLLKMQSQTDDKGNKEFIYEQTDLDEQHMAPKEMITLLQAYETWLYEKQYKAAMEDLYTENKGDNINGKEENIYRRGIKLISSPQYELGMNIITIINVFTVFIRALQQSASESTIRAWIILELTINLFMLLEAVADIIMAGPIKAYRYHFRIWPETLCQLLNLPAMIMFFRAGDDFQQYNYTVKIFEVIVFIRMLKLLTLLFEIKTMRVIFETLKNLLGPLNNLIIVMMTIFYVFALLGSIMFGGLIRVDSPQIVHDSSIPDNYYLMNFNDLVSSYITLFVLIVVNNWYVIVAMCVDIKSGATIYRYFFVIFYYFGVIIGLNIIIAFAIDMYAAVQRLEEQKDDNKDYLIGLAEKQHTTFQSQSRVRSNSGDSDESYMRSPRSNRNLTLQ